MITEGTVAFASLKEHDVYMGKSTGKYTLTVSLTPEEASKLDDAGVQLRVYEGTPQRKFSCQYDVVVVDTEDNPFNGNIPRGSKVRILWTAGKPHPVHGVSSYLSRVRVLELADDIGGSASAEGF